MQIQVVEHSKSGRGSLLEPEVYEGVVKALILRGDQHQDLPTLFGVSQTTNIIP